MAYIYEQVASRDNSIKWWSSHHDVYDMFMQAGSAGELGVAVASTRSASGRSSSSIRPTTPSGSEQAVDKLLADAAAQGAGDAGSQPLGARRTSTARPAVYKAIKPKDADDDKVSW